MTQYIDKSDIVAEIERLQDSIKATAIDDRISKEQAEAYKVCVKLRKFVEDAIEDVDLEKELYDFIEKQKAWVRDDRVVEYNNGDSFNHIYDLELVAKHFFELGLNYGKEVRNECERL